MPQRRHAMAGLKASRSLLHIGSTRHHSFARQHSGHLHLFFNRKQVLHGAPPVRAAGSRTSAGNHSKLARVGQPSMLGLGRGTLSTSTSRVQAGSHPHASSGTADMNHSLHCDMIRTLHGTEIHHVQHCYYQEQRDVELHVTTGGRYFSACLSRRRRQSSLGSRRGKGRLASHITGVRKTKRPNTIQRIVRLLSSSK